MGNKLYILFTYIYIRPKKEMEYKLKSMTCGKTISCIPPIDYAERFTKFITDMFI